MRVVVHRDVPDDPSLQRQWNALAQAMESPEVFYTHQWALAVSRTYAQLLVPMLVLGYEAEELIGVAALATDLKTDPINTDSTNKKISFLCGTTADYCDLVSHPDRRAEFLDAVLGELRRVGLPNIVWTSLPAESDTSAALPAAARKHGYQLFVRPTAVCAQVNLGTQEERAKLKTELGKKKIFRHSMNSLAREGPVSFSHLRSWEELEPVLANFNVAHVARFLATGRISNLASAPRRAFLYELARLLSGSGWLVLSRMLVADRPIAWNYGFQFQHGWFWYQPTFDTAYERLSPGYCLLSKIISEACDQEEMRAIDLGLGAEGYKERFANHTRSTVHATLAMSATQHVREMIRYHAAQAVKSVPGAESAVRAVLGYICSAPQRFEKRGSVGRNAKRVPSLLVHREEILFYQWTGDHPAQTIENLAEGLSLRPVDLETLAVAAMTYQNDEDKLSYLLRSAGRLQSKTGNGFALIDRENVPVHFCWAADFEGFEMKELRTRLSAPSQNATLIFDCWTPPSKRGRGYFKSALSLAARQLSNHGKDPWTFSATTNDDCWSGVVAAGFERKYSMICKKTLAWQRVTKVAFDAPGRNMEAQARP